MPQAKSKATDDDFAALGRELRDSFGANPEAVPPGWYTTEQWAQKWGYARAYAHRLLTHGVAIGRVEWRKFRVPTEMKKSYATVHYRMMPRPKNLKKDSR